MDSDALGAAGESDGGMDFEASLQYLAQCAESGGITITGELAATMRTWLELPVPPAYVALHDAEPGEVVRVLLSREVPEPSVTEYPRVTTLKEARALIAQLTDERDHARRLLNNRQAELDRVRQDGVNGRICAEVLLHVVSLFTTDSAGWARSVYVAPDDLHGWRRVAKALLK